MSKTKSPPSVAQQPSPVVPLPSHEEDPYLTFTAAGERLGVSHTTVGNYVSQRLIKAVWRGGRLCIRESALAEFQGKNYEPPNKEK